MDPNNIELLKLSTSVKCEKCSEEVFSEAVMLRKVSRLVAGTPKDAIIPIPVFVCRECSNINEEFIPTILKQLRDEQKQTD